MEAVQLQCGNCLKRIAIGVEHLGGQVQCPYCHAVVQTPASAPPVDAPTERMEASEVEPLLRDASPGEESALPKFAPRPIHDRSLLPLIALIFLVPYAIFTTLFILYLIFLTPPRLDPMEYLRDPVPEKGKGGPRRGERLQPKHDQPLNARLRTKLGTPIQAGDLLVTPTRIRLTPQGDLQLLLRTQNKSADTSFEPIHELYIKYDSNRKDIKPYTFVESKRPSVEPLYGQYLEFHPDVEAKEKPPSSSLLRPDAELTISLTTYESLRPQVAAIAKGDDVYLWRVRVRRGFVKVDGKDVSATMVVGVEFTSDEIEKKG